MLEKANMLLLTKEATEKDRNLKTQLLLMTNSQNTEKISGEQIWKKFSYFYDKKADFTIEKKNFPENALCYVNQAYLSTVKNGELAIYNHNFIIGQLVVAANQPCNIDEYVCKNDEVELITCLYDKSTGQLNGLTLRLTYIVLRGDLEESFFSYGVNEEKSTVLYSVSKKRIPNAFVSTCFKKHFREIIDERRHNEEFSRLFYYLPSITDCKEKINQLRDNVNLNPIDCTLDHLNSFSSDPNFNFQPPLLNSTDVENRAAQTDVLYKFFRHVAEVSNANLIRNAEYLLAASKEKRNNSKIAWVGPSKQ